MSSILDEFDRPPPVKTKKRTTKQAQRDYKLGKFAARMRIDANRKKPHWVRQLHGLKSQVSRKAKEATLNNKGGK